MKIAVIGSRGFDNYGQLKQALDSMTPEMIISGGAVGADQLAAKYAKENNISLVEFFPDYKQYGRVAPLKRNRQIIEAADMIIAFWDGSSPGTQNAIKYARSLKKPVELVYSILPE